MAEKYRVYYRRNKTLREVIQDTDPRLALPDKVKAVLIEVWLADLTASDGDAVAPINIRVGSAVAIDLMAELGVVWTTRPTMTELCSLPGSVPAFVFFDPALGATEIVTSSAPQYIPANRPQPGAVAPGAPVGGSGVVTINFGGAGATVTSVVVTGQPVQLTSAIAVNLLAMPTIDHSIDEHVVEEIDVIAGNIVAGVGFTIYARTRNRSLRGTYSVAWRWS